MTNVSPSVWRGYADEIDQAEAQIEAGRLAKLAILRRVREEHGRMKALAFNAAVKMRRMDEATRQAADELEVESFNILKLIKPVGTNHAIARASGEPKSVAEPVSAPEPKPVEPAPLAHVHEAPAAEPKPAAPAFRWPRSAPKPADEGIPSFLRRGDPQNAWVRS